MGDEIDLRLDVSGKCCPLPLVELAKSIGGVSPGKMLEITGNDPIFEATVRDFCQANGHAVVDVATSDDGVVRIRIRVGK